MSRYYGGYPPYVSVAEKRAKAERKLKQLMKKNPKIRPIMIEGTALARTWWGKEWNKNLERYADYSNRIGRGRSYVRHRAVLDLQIKPGEVNALVQGSTARPYKVTIKIKAISKTAWANMQEACAGQFDSLQKLLNGKFPKALKDIFTTKGKGLFPTPLEIDFSCSCPDWASMCKHVAAALYGVGARLDEDPSLFFKLRKGDMDALVSQAVADKTDKMLKKAEKKSSRVMEDADLADVFGIDLDDNEAIAIPKKAPAKSAASRKRTGKAVKTAASKTARTRRKAKPRKAAAKATASKTAKRKTLATKTARRSKAVKKPSPKANRTGAQSGAVPTPAELVAGIIAKSRKGVGIATLKQKTGFEQRKLYNIVHKLKKEGRIKSVKWGVYKGV